MKLPSHTLNHFLIGVKCLFKQTVDDKNLDFFSPSLGFKLPIHIKIPNLYMSEIDGILNFIAVILTLLKYFFFFFLENRICHFMQGDNLHQVSDPIF